MPKPVDLSKSLAVLDQDSALIVVIELSQPSCGDPKSRLRIGVQGLSRILLRSRGIVNVATASRKTCQEGKIGLAVRVRIWAKKPLRLAAA